MTLIIGYIKDGKSYMCGDSAAVSGLSREARLDKKVFQYKEMLIGGTTSFRMLQLLNYKLTIEMPPVVMGSDYHEWMCTKFVDHVREVFKTNGYGPEKDGEKYGGSFLVAFRGKLFNIDNDFQVGIPSMPYDAIGCGATLALGAMDAFGVSGWPSGTPEWLLIGAMRIATGRNGGVMPPYVTIEL